MADCREEIDENVFAEAFELFVGFDGCKRDNFINRESGSISLKVKDFTIKVHQDRELLCGKGVTGAAVWDSGMVLAKFVEFHHQELIANKSIIEIGAGCGVTGLVACRLGCKEIIFTDQIHMLPLLTRNVEENAQQMEGVATVKEFTWKEDDIPDWIVEKHFDVVLAADCVFNESINADLVAVLVALCPTSSTIVLLSSELRSSSVMENFLERIIKHFDMYRIAASEWHPQFKCDSVVMYAMRRRKDSSSNSGMGVFLEERIW